MPFGFVLPFSEAGFTAALRLTLGSSHGARLCSRLQPHNKAKILALFGSRLEAGCVLAPGIPQRIPHGEGAFIEGRILMAHTHNPIQRFMGSYKKLQKHNLYSSALILLAFTALIRTTREPASTSYVKPVSTTCTRQIQTFQAVLIRDTASIRGFGAIFWADVGFIPSSVLNKIPCPPGLPGILRQAQTHLIPNFTYLSTTLSLLQMPQQLPTSCSHISCSHLPDDAAIISNA